MASSTGIATVLSRTRRTLSVGVVQVCLDVRFSFPAGAATMTVLELLVLLDSQLYDIFNSIFTQEEVSDDDHVGVAVEFHGDGQRFFTFSKYSNEPVRTLFRNISKVLQSNTTLMFRVWTIEVQIIRTPSGKGRKRNFSHMANFKKTSTVTIFSPDGLCLWRAVVVALAHKDRVAQKEAGLLSPAIIQRKFAKIARSGSRLQKERALALQGASQTYRGDFGSVAVLSRHLRRNITVVSQSAPGYIAFRSADAGADFGVSTTLYLLFHNEHYDVITTIKCVLRVAPCLLCRLSFHAFLFRLGFTPRVKYAVVALHQDANIDPRACVCEFVSQNNTVYCTYFHFYNL